MPGFVLLGLLACLVFSAPCRGQDDTGAAGLSPDSPAALGGGLQLKVTRFGVAGRPRAGEWFGMQVEFLSASDRLANVLLRLSVPDPDGDTAWYERAVVPNPNVRQSAWLYARFPHGLLPGAALTLQAFEAVDQPGDDPAATPFRAGALLGQLAVAVPQPIPSTAGAIAMVGNIAAGLNQYSESRLATADYLPTGHEEVELYRSLLPGDLPDRWMGYAPFETLVWSGGGAAGRSAQPSDLTPPQAQALGEWVRRGGHLVAILPSVGQAWLDRDHPLVSIIPDVVYQAVENADLEPLRPLLTSRPDAPLEPRTTVHYLAPAPSAGPQDAMCVLAGPKPDGTGGCVVMRRPVGIGAVTLVGIDLANPRLAGRRGVDAEVFWNRVLGRRARVLPPDELDRLHRSGEFRLLNRRDRVYDGGVIEQEIAKQGKAAAGLLLAFVIFLLYWVIAGPLGYLVLKARGRAHFSWLAFVGAAGLFTAVAWGGANLLKQRSVEAQHLSVIDHVFGQPSQRVRGWHNIFLPAYGAQSIALEPGGEQWTQAVAAWDSPESGTHTGLFMFPDARGYPVPCRAPSRLRVPARSTTKHVQVDWAGAPRAGWQMPVPRSARAETPEIGDELVVERAPGGGWAVRGTLRHDLPGPLRDVVIVVSAGQAETATGVTGALVREARAVSLTDRWAPGSDLDLWEVTQTRPGIDSSADRYFKDLLGGRPSQQFIPTDGARLSDDKRFGALSFFHLLEPPNPRSQDPSWVARRVSLHGLDLSRWLTQPCVVVIGHLDEAPSPAPLLVDGAVPKTTGHVVVRWVYPLAPRPPELTGLAQ